MPPNAKSFKQSQKEGLRAEDLFREFAEKQGYAFEESPPSWNIHKHIDCFLSKDGKKRSFDVKALKRVARGNQYSQNSEIWVEFKNVRGRKGWLYGEADMIAFQDTEDSFLIFKREDLVSFCEEMVDETAVASSTRDALYKVYTRKDRKDVISRIKRADLIAKYKPTLLTR